MGHVIDYCSRISDALHSSMAGAGQENRYRWEGNHTGKEWMKLSVTLVFKAHISVKASWLGPGAEFSFTSSPCET